MTRYPVHGELVTFKNLAGFHHDGILYERPQHRTTVIHVHGSLGNFYQNEFLRVMAAVYTAHGINLLSFNLRGHDALAEGYRNEWDFEYAGGSIATFTECVIDLQAAVDFVAPFSDRIILQGHSMGCDRVLHYLLSTGADYDAILLSPCDSYQLQANWIAPETVEHQIARLKRHTPSETHYEWLSPSEFGITQGDWDYSIPITRPVLLALMEGPVFQLLRLSRPAHFYLNQRLLVYIGGDDTLQAVPREEMFRHLSERSKDARLMSLYPEGDHSLWGCEREVCGEIVPPRISWTAG